MVEWNATKSPPAIKIVHVQRPGFCIMSRIHWSNANPEKQNRWKRKSVARVNSQTKACTFCKHLVKNVGIDWLLVLEYFVLLALVLFKDKSATFRTTVQGRYGDPYD
jgi:hypothetical protein